MRVFVTCIQKHHFKPAAFAHSVVMYLYKKGHFLYSSTVADFKAVILISNFELGRSSEHSIYAFFLIKLDAKIMVNTSNLCSIRLSLRF